MNQLLSERGEDFGSLAIAQFLEFRECWDCPEAKNFSEISGKLPLQSVTPIFTEDPNSPDESIIKQLKDIVGGEIDEMFNSGRFCQTHRWLWDGPSPGSRSRGLLEKSQKFWDWDWKFCRGPKNPEKNTGEGGYNNGKCLNFCLEHYGLWKSVYNIIDSKKCSML